MSSRIKVLIVDDSAIIRKMLSKLLSFDPDFEVVATAHDPYIAREKIIQLKPDVLTLDIEMPKMDGITFLSKLMQAYPIRTLVLSSLSKANSEIAYQAFEAGAIDVMEKPSIDVSSSLKESAHEIITRLKVVSRAKLDIVLDKKKARPKKVVKTSLSKTTHQIIGIAASTGGTQALREMLPLFPVDIPGTVIVQHMPPVFTLKFAESLNDLCSFEVKEAQDGDRVLPGRALIAPGNFHMEVSRQGAYYHVKLHQGPFVHGVRPAADYLFNSLSRVAGKNCVGTILTGMGQDGAEGLLNMKKAGAFNIAQDEKSCIIYGMPKAAVDLGATDQTASLLDIPELLLREIDKRE